MSESRRTKLKEYPETEYGELNTDIRRKNLCKNRWLINNYGLTLKAYRNMHDAQKGTCALCEQPEEIENIELAVDHDHNTGAVRALLCSKCNKALGLFNDDIERLQVAINYLTQHAVGG